MEKLLEKKCGAYLYSGSFYAIPNVKGDIFASWPFSKLTMYSDKLVIKVAAQGEFTFPYKNIVSIEKKVGCIKISHNVKGIKPSVFLRGIGTGSFLFGKIKNVINQNSLKIKTN